MKRFFENTSTSSLLHTFVYTCLGMPGCQIRNTLTGVFEGFHRRLAFS